MWQSWQSSSRNSNELTRFQWINQWNPDWTAQWYKSLLCLDAVVHSSFSRKHSYFRHFLQSKFTASFSLLFKALKCSSEEWFLFCWLVMSCCCSGFLAGTFAERRCEWFGQLFQLIMDRRLVWQSYFALFYRYLRYAISSTSPIIDGMICNKARSVVRLNIYRF